MNRIATAVAVLAAAACTQCGTGTTTVAPTNTHTAAPASPTTTSAPPKTVDLQPGPHSALADIDLPAGTVSRGTTSDWEIWSYSAPYDDVVAFLRKQFTTGRRYDAYGATWWNGLPPCYDDSKYNPADPAHESPPRGWIEESLTIWRWCDGAITLDVEVLKPRVNEYGNITIGILTGLVPPCNRA